mmetsp:Transcript_16679/g.48714  ORF Transcript_16679/g.48714 Transcript_16679/m.48714 type:complete len:301 (+) Transcript_16679:97-999(+)
MNTSRDSLTSSTPHSSSGSPLKSMCTPWKTNLRSCPWICRMPFMRKMSTPLEANSSVSQPFIETMSNGLLAFRPTDVIEESCWCSPSSSRKSGSMSSTFARENAFTPSTKSSAKPAPFVQRTSGASLFKLLSLASTRCSCSSSTRSHLFTNILSAKATCSTASFSTPSGLISPSLVKACLASTTVTRASNRARSFSTSSTKNVWATGAGSARPVVSTMTPSNGFIPGCSSLFRILDRSARTVQQMHPLFISKMSSSALTLRLTNRSSMPNSPNSFTMTAYFVSCFSVRILLSSVVLPAPR